MSDLKKATITKAAEPNKAGCCVSGHDTDSKHQAVPPIPQAKAEPSDRVAHVHPADANGSCCGSGKVGK